MTGVAAVALACGLCDCGSDAQDPATAPTPRPSPTATPTPEPTPEPTPRDLDPRTVGYWTFEEGTPDIIAVGEGTIRDSSPSADHGSPSGSPFYRADVAVETIPQTGAPNTLSLAFDSVDDHVSFASRFPLNDPGDATIEFWIKHPGDTHEAVVWGRLDSHDANRFHIYVNDNQTLCADYRNAAGDIFFITYSMPFTPNVWTHFAIVRSGSAYTSYRDGVLMATLTAPESELPTSVGWKLSGRTTFEFSGRVDELRLVRAALSPQEFLNASPAP